MCNHLSTSHAIISYHAIDSVDRPALRVNRTMQQGQTLPKREKYPLLNCLAN